MEMVLVCSKNGGMCNHKKKANGACGSVRYPFSIYWWFSLRAQGFKQPHVSTLTGVELFLNRWWTSRKALLVMHELRCDACVPWGYSPRIYVAYLHGCYTYNAWDAHPSSWWFIDVHWCSVWSTIEKMWSWSAFKHVVTLELWLCHPEAIRNLRVVFHGGSLVVSQDPDDPQKAGVEKNGVPRNAEEYEWLILFDSHRIARSMKNGVLMKLIFMIFAYGTTIKNFTIDSTNSPS